MSTAAASYLFCASPCRELRGAVGTFHPTVVNMHAVQVGPE